MKLVVKKAFILAIMLFPLLATAQIPEQMIKIIVAPDHDNWQYKTGEKVKFTVRILYHNNDLKGMKAYYEVGPEKMEPVKKDSVELVGRDFVIDAGTMTNPGFLRCVVSLDYEGRRYRGLATAGFNCSDILPTVQMPADFSEFWKTAKSELAGIPVNARMILMPERCTDKVDVYNVSIQNIGNSKVYGILSVPRKEGKYPAVLEVPGAGVRGYSPDISLAEKGFITFVIGIHGIPVTLDPVVYTDLANGALREYWAINLDSRERYYYKRVYLGCVRANDFLTSLPKFDGANLAVTGGSQGGALSVITASLDDRIIYLAAAYPALSDITGYNFNRAGGWPHMLDRNNMRFHNTKEKLATIPYYDVVNFARGIKVPGFYTWGFNDETCPPTSMYSVFNVISAPKTLNLVLETGHWTYPEQSSRLTNSIVERLGNSK